MPEASALAYIPEAQLAIETARYQQMRMLAVKTQRPGRASVPL